MKRSTLALALAALCLAGRTAGAQTADVTYSSWPVGFHSNLTVGQGSNIYGSFAGFGGSDVRGGFSYMRTNFPNGWFVGGGSGPAFGFSGIAQAGAFGNSLTSEGAQVGYTFQNAPLTVYAGFDTLKYNTGIGSPFAPFDAASGTLPGYRAHAGVEFSPAPNLSLSLGVGYTQTPARSELDSLVLPGASAFGRR